MRWYRFFSIIIYVTICVHGIISYFIWIRHCKFDSTLLSYCICNPQMVKANYWKAFALCFYIYRSCRISQTGEHIHISLIILCQRLLERKPLRPATRQCDTIFFCRVLPSSFQGSLAKNSHFIMYFHWNFA